VENIHTSVGFLRPFSFDLGDRARTDKGQTDGQDAQCGSLEQLHNKKQQK